MTMPTIPHICHMHHMRCQCQKFQPELWVLWLALWVKNKGAFNKLLSGRPKSEYWRLNCWARLVWNKERKHFERHRCFAEQRSRSTRNEPLRKLGEQFFLGSWVGNFFEEAGWAFWGRWEGKKEEMCCFTFCTVSNFSNKQRQFWRKSTRHTLEGEISVEI